MAQYFISFDGSDSDPIVVDAPSEDDARNAAVIELGRHLQEHPEFAATRHWRVDLKTESGRLLLNIVVATVTAPHALNRASFDELPVENL